jgi:hypothetical protein
MPTGDAPMIMSPGLILLCVVGCGLDPDPHAHDGAGATPPAAADHTETFLADIVRLTNPEAFSRAGEAYFSPDRRWIIFQAVPTQDETGAQPRYSMYVAPVSRDETGRITGAGDPILISSPGSANTCGWFHPSLPGVVLFGSTMAPPHTEAQAGYSRDTSRYTWDFPPEMEIVTRTVRAIVEDSVQNSTVRAELLARPDVERAVPMFTTDGYDAEGSWSPDGRFVLYTHMDPATLDADIHLYDIAAGRSIPIVVAPGYDGGPFFSPDGKRVCYRSDRKGDNLLQVFVADLAFDERGVPTRIERETQLTSNGHVNWAPFWHPSGAYLVYATSQVSHRNYEVFAIAAHTSADGSLPTPVRVTGAEGFDGLPVFSSDGAAMMWTGQRDAPDAAGKRTSQIYAARVTADVPEGLHIAGIARLNTHTDPIADALADADPETRRFHEHITVLASDWMAGRYPGTPEIATAEDYIRARFERAGLTPAFTDAGGSTTFFQPFDLAHHKTGTILSARNIAGIIPGKGPLADRSIVIGAHHDHLGMGETGSMRGAGEIHEGADDNASGVAGILLLADRLTRAYAALPEGSSARTIVLATFSAEEMGLNGSREFVKSPPVDLAACDLMINFDMIGRVTSRRVNLSGFGSGAELRPILDSILTDSAATPLKIITPDGLTARSDHTSFYDAKVPVLFVTIDPYHTDYHTPDDDAWKINNRDAVEIVRLIERCAVRIAAHPDPIAFAEVASFDRGPSPSMGSLKVRFGIMPGNYNDTEPGVLVQRVSPGGSAEAGGIRAGDRLMAWNGSPITTVTSWMELMGAHSPGDTVTVTVLRDGANLDLQVTLQASAPRTE